MCSCSETKKKDRSELGIPPCSCNSLFTPKELAYITLVVGKASATSGGISAYEKLYELVMRNGKALIAMHDLEDQFSELRRKAGQNFQQ